MTSPLGLEEGDMRALSGSHRPAAEPQTRAATLLILL
jgi:hypothetical protein